MWMQRTPIKTRHVRSLEDFHSCLRHHEKSPWGIWYRGHRNSAWRLEPAIFAPRQGRTDVSKREGVLLLRFKLYAPAIDPNFPDDPARQLAHARHHGLPTRLLDWTRSPLIAAYFATLPTLGPASKSAAIWSLYPYNLNLRTTGHSALYPLDGNQAEPLLQGAFRTTAPHENDKNANPEQMTFLSSSELVTEPEVMAVLPTEAIPRQRAQQTCFTIHSCHGALDRLKPDGQVLQRWKIHESAVEPIRDHLHRCGVTRSALFPDLDALAFQIADEEGSGRS